MSTAATLKSCGLERFWIPAILLLVNGIVFCKIRFHVDNKALASGDCDDYDLVGILNLYDRSGVDWLQAFRMKAMLSMAVLFVDSLLLFVTARLWEKAGETQENNGDVGVGKNVVAGGGKNEGDSLVLEKDHSSENTPVSPEQTAVFLNVLYTAAILCAAGCLVCFGLLITENGQQSCFNSERNVSAPAELPAEVKEWARGRHHFLGERVGT